VTCKKAKQ